MHWPPAVTLLFFFQFQYAVQQAAAVFAVALKCISWHENRVTFIPLFWGGCKIRNAFYNDTQDNTFLTLVLLKGNRLTNYLLFTLLYAHALLACVLLKKLQVRYNWWRLVILYFVEILRKIKIPIHLVNNLI